MDKNKKTKQKQTTPKKKFIEKHVKADDTVEYIVTNSPSKTWWGKVIVGLIIIGTLLVPIIALIISLFQ